MLVIVDSQKKTSLLVWYIYFVQCVVWVEMTIAFSLEMNDYILILVCLLIILLWWPISSYRAVMQSPNWRWLKTILDSLKNKGARSAQVQNCLCSMLNKDSSGCLCSMELKLFNGILSCHELLLKLHLHGSHQLHHATTSGNGQNSDNFKCCHFKVALFL